jgi:uncharacterized protein YecE (DUF72 family)
VSKRRDIDQLGLFGATAEEPVRIESVVEESDRELASRVPELVRLGSSSWTFAGWAGLVYAGKHTERTLAAHGLRAYAENPLYRTVGIDRSYYDALTEENLTSYAAQLPPGFLAVSKVPRELTSAVFAEHPSMGALAGKRNESFLDPAKMLDTVIARYERAFAAHAGPFVFELAPAPRGAVPPADYVVGAIDRLLRALPRSFSYAFEIRNRDHLTPAYFDVLREHGAGHVLNYWTRMPTVGEQLDMPGVLTAPFVVTRLMLPPGARYEENKESFAPFDRIVKAQPQMRADVVRLARTCVEAGKKLFVIVSNKAEGSSPWTIRALAESVGAGRGNT